MNIQSLSIVVPNKACINHCASCPSRMHDNNYPILIDESLADFDLYFKDYMKRLEFARDNGCNTVMLTGTSEPQQNRKFLLWFGMMMQMMKNPFKSIEIQCTGALIDEDYITFLRRHVGLTMMALSMFALDKNKNMTIINPPKHIDIDPLKTAALVKESGMSLRICLNLTKHFDGCIWHPENLFKAMRNEYGADQLTLRVLYSNDENSTEGKWVKENAASEDTVRALRRYITSNGKLLGRLPYGAKKYAVDGMSVVIDDDSMGKNSDDVDSYKYLILQPDCKLYSAWDDHGSLVF